MVEQLKNNLDVIDVWSLGASLLEILTGIPHWLAYKCCVTYEGKSFIRTGLFATKGVQDYPKLL